MHRFYQEGFSKGDVTIRDSVLAHQMRKVLRLQSGDIISLFNVVQGESRYTIQTISKEFVQLSYKDDVSETRELDRDIRLAVAIPNKQSTVEFIIQKATEMGVSSIDFITSVRSSQHLAWRDRLDTIIKEAVEQSGRLSFPEVSIGISFSDWCSRYDSFYIPDSYDQTHSSIMIPEERAVIIGPEGGFSREEIEEAVIKGGKCVSLGSTILRMETACIVALAKMI